MSVFQRVLRRIPRRCQHRVSEEVQYFILRLCMLGEIFRCQQKYIYIYYRFIVRFPIGLDFLFITFLLHFLLSWTSSLSISSSAISASTLSNHVFLGLPTGLLPSTPYISSPSPHHMSIPSQSTTSNESCDRLNSNQPSQFFICHFVFQ